MSTKEHVAICWFKAPALERMQQTETRKKKSEHLVHYFRVSWGTRGVPIRGLSSHLLVCVRVQLQKFSVFFCPTANKRQQRGGRWGHSRIHLLFIFKRLSFGCCCCCCCHWQLICGRCLFMCFVYLCRAHDYCRRARTAACLSNSLL